MTICPSACSRCLRIRRRTVGAVLAAGAILASSPAGTTSRPPRMTGGSGDSLRSSWSSSMRFCSRACSVSARFRASLEFSRAFGLSRLLLLLQILGAVIPVVDFLREPVLHRRLGLGDQFELARPNLFEMLRHDLRDRVGQRLLLQVAD